MDLNPDYSITEAKQELALSKPKLANKKNPQKLMEEIASERLNMESQLATARRSRNSYALAKRIQDCHYCSSNVQEK